MSELATWLLKAVLAVLLVLGAMSCGSEEPPGNNGAEENNFSTDNTVIDRNTVSTELPSYENLSFVEAVQQGVVEYQVTGNGNSTGDSLRIRIRRTATQPVTLRIAPGTVFGTRSAGVQRMVAWSVRGSLTDAPAGSFRPTDLIELLDDEYHEFIVEAYCMDFELDNPSGDDAFTATAVNERAASILRAAKDRGLSIVATQVAIWMDDGLSGQEITGKFEASEQDLEDARQLLSSLPRRT